MSSIPYSQLAAVHQSSPPSTHSTAAEPNRSLQSVGHLIDVGLAQPTIENPNMAQNFGNVAVDIDLLEKEIAAKDQARRDASPHSYTDLSGQIAGVSQPQKKRTHMVEAELDTDFDTLDEPVWDTVKRDLRKVGAKFATVLFPKNNDQLLRDWDLWGPLFICVFISLLLQCDNTGKGPHFTEIFTLTFFGSCVVTLNIKLLGGTISFFQSLCVLGYCLLPPGAAALLCHILEFASRQSNFIFALRLIITAMGFFWATYAAMAFLSSPASQPPKRKALVVYPIFLFYFVISWLILTHAS